MITGKFLRHSKEFYEWRIQDRLKKLVNDPDNLAYLDDLAVAYEKTGQHDKAIETMLSKEQIKPGLYETYSNLGTFYVLAGDFEKGLPYIYKALEINPDAHFGRERYQKWLIEYAMEKRTDGKLAFPLRWIPRREIIPSQPETGFTAFLKEKYGWGKTTQTMTEDDLKAAVKGVLGMMRFANHDNPLLLEALGDLLSEGGFTANAKLLAARCYLKAGNEVRDAESYRRYHILAEKALSMQRRPANSKYDLKELEIEFAEELNNAEKWYSELRDREIGWIQAGKDVEAEFDQLYSQEPTIGLAPEIDIEPIVASKPKAAEDSGAVSGTFTDHQRQSTEEPELTGNSGRFAAVVENAAYVGLAIFAVALVGLFCYRK